MGNIIQQESQGKTLHYQATFVDEDGDPFDLTDCEIYMTIKGDLADSDEDALVSIDITDIPDPTAGVANIVVPAADSANVTGEVYYDIVLKDSTGNVYKVDAGRAKFEQAVTRRTWEA